ncbi:TetR/AcrR family transcriptional regulator [Nocardioides halotolerans]|uniref:TetR/AcrR family transcriptional regulator n=1 Tax=Nocardioides halotolerans TaxID=433660 RepID=UPI000A04A643|nr:TetR/AcrR family transcriptional regulator [Nocardioides halotolerans]
MTATTPRPEEAPNTRRRIGGPREEEILQAALDVLIELSYDRLTMDAIATRARVSKASLYRHYGGKPALVLRALRTMSPPLLEPDPGGLRAELLRAYRSADETADCASLAIVASVASALTHDPEFAEAFESVFIEPRVRRIADIYRRAQARGEVRDDVDPEFLAPVLSALALQRQLRQATTADAGYLERAIDELILPAVSTGSGAANR